MTALPRVGSDHAPMVIDTGVRRVTSPKIFQFKKCWLDQPDFKDLVRNIWNTPVPGRTAMDIWMNKSRLFRKKVKGWSINIEAGIKKKKRELLLEFDILDVFSERNQINDVDKHMMEEIKNELNGIWSKEETAFWQRSRDRKIVDCDKNNAYFQAVANHRHRKNHLSKLNGDNGPVYSTKEMLEVATTFYKNLFGAEKKPYVHLGPSFWEEGDLVTEEENDRLQSNFSEEEIKEAIFGSYAHGAPGPDGLSFLFYQTFWDVIKADFMALVRDFEEGKLDLQRLNFALIVLIPKEPDAKDLKKFRPISLSNCGIKIFSKAMTNRVSPIGRRLISSNQTAFIKGRYILELSWLMK